MAAFGKPPAAVRLGLEFGLAVEHLFSGLAEELRNSQVKFRRQPLNFLVNPVGQLDFSSFHKNSLPKVQGFGKAN